MNNNKYLGNKYIQPTDMRASISYIGLQIEEFSYK